MMMQFSTPEVAAQFLPSIDILWRPIEALVGLERILLRVQIGEHIIACWRFLWYKTNNIIFIITVLILQNAGIKDLH